MEKYKNEYIITSTFSFEDYYGKKWTLEEDTWLKYRGHQEGAYWHFGWVNGKSIFIPENLVKSHIRNYLELYQEQFSHLKQNNLHFGQILFEAHFFIEENGHKRFYQKIGDYITANGDKYNAVEGKKESICFTPSNIEDYSKVKLVYFNDQDIIKSNYKFSKYENQSFLPIEPIKVCEYVTHERRMLEVIECFFSGKELTQELNDIYEKYEENRSWDEEQSQGFTSHQDKPLNEIRDEIIDDMKKYNKDSQYYFDYLLKNNMNNPEFNKEKVLKDVSRDGYVLLWCNEEMINDREVVMAAVKQNKEVLLYASQEIRDLIGENLSNPVKALEALMLDEKIQKIIPDKFVVSKNKVKI